MDEGTGMTMAQPSSVQREPSMEEILASIRRIIEDNETSRKDEKPAAQPESPKAMEPSPVSVDEPSVQEQPAQPVAVSQVAKPANIANEMVSIKPAPYKPEVVTLERPSPAPVIEEAEEEDVFEPEVEMKSADVEPVAEVELEPVVEPKVATEISDVAVNSAPIVSEQSERKIAMAFSELNEAYQSVRRKTLADAAEDMLRPMLREWIDENLPQLVEKLVREEIERIARGS